MNKPVYNNKITSSSNDVRFLHSACDLNYHNKILIIIFCYIIYFYYFRYEIEIKK